jgi:dGTP triphosphohydrolase
MDTDKLLVTIKIKSMKSKIIFFAVATFCTGALFHHSAAATYSSKPSIQTATQEAEWQAFKKEQEEKIKKNEERIAELKKAKASSGKATDDVYNKRIDKLQIKNNELKMKIANYKYENTKWDQFKREFNRDMDEVGKSLKDLGTDNVK